MHPIRRLIHDFEDLVNLPVEPDDVRKWIVDHGFCDEVRVHYVDCDPLAFDGLYIERQGGALIEHHAAYGAPHIVREIFINKNLSVERRRLAEVKECLHILDALIQRSATLDKINDMIVFAATRMRLKEKVDGPDVGMWADIAAFPQALAILFPWETRHLLKPKFDAGQLSSAEIADMVELPVAYVETVLSDQWESSYDFVLSCGDRHYEEVEVAKAGE